jgi:hypothetical protein
MEKIGTNGIAQKELLLYLWNSFGLTPSKSLTHLEEMEYLDLIYINNGVYELKTEQSIEKKEELAKYYETKAKLLRGESLNLIKKPNNITTKQLDKTKELNKNIKYKNNSKNESEDEEVKKFIEELSKGD